MILSTILAVCTLPFASCAGGNSHSTESHSTATGAHATSIAQTPGQTPGGVVNYPQSTAFDKIPANAQKWIDNASNPTSVLLTYDQIQEANKQIRGKCSALKDIENHKTTMPASEVKALIEASSGPSLPKYDNKGNAISQAKYEEIKNNRNVSALSGEITLKRAVTVQRTDVRALPTAIEFYNNSNKQDHDRMQETELAAASAVLVLHTSVDGKFYFIQSYYYTGWVDVNNIAIATDDSYHIWQTYAKLLNMSENATKNINFAVITDAQLNVGGIKLDMGTALPLSSNQGRAASGNYRVILPAKANDGTLNSVEADVPVSASCVGYAQYTLRNFYVQAFKYSGTPYGWGGMHGNVDCSSFVLSVFKTFGFVFPRNTSQQNKVVGSAVNVENKTTDDKISMLNNTTAPVVIYKSGHAMIYLGKISDTHYIIHAPGGGYVCEESYNGFSSLISICQVG